MTALILSKVPLLTLLLVGCPTTLLLPCFLRLCDWIHPGAGRISWKAQGSCNKLNNNLG